MARIRMAVEVHNESSVPLLWDHDSLEHGDWTDPWYPSRHRTIAPGEKAEWRAEGNNFLTESITGTEGRVWYNIDGDKARQLYIHFNSPWIESQYGNTFHVWGPPRFAAAYDGGQGRRARLVVRFRDSARRSVPGFTPSTNGFGFSNTDWSAELPVMTVGFVWNRLLEKLGTPVARTLEIGKVDEEWLPFTRASAGMCGGMVFAAMDYFAAGTLPPRRSTPPDRESDPLFRFIRRRLRDSFDLGGRGHRWLGYSSPHYPNGDEGFVQTAGLARGRAWVTYRDEWPRIRDDIDHGRPSPLALVQTNSLDLGANHQVLGYAYQQNGQLVDLWVYDPNHPGVDDLVLRFDITDTASGIKVDRLKVGSGHPQPAPVGGPRIWCIFRTDGYQAETPPAGQPLTVRLALERHTGRREGRLPADAGLSRPASVRGWLSQGF
jgi:hypothetical protein